MALGDIIPKLEGEYDHWTKPEFIFGVNNGVLALRSDGSTFTFSDLDGIQALVTGTSATLQRLMELYQQQHGEPLQAMRSGIYVPFSNFGAHYFSDGERLSSEPEGIAIVDGLLKKFQSYLEMVASHPEADETYRMRADAFLFPEAVPEELLHVDERQKAKEMKVPYDEAVRIVSTLKLWQSELRYRTTLDQALDTFL